MTYVRTARPPKGGGASMPRNATARREPEVADEAASTRVDELIQLGRGQGYLSLTELRAAFGEAGVSPAEGRSIIRELAEAWVRLGDEPGGHCRRRPYLKEHCPKASTDGHGGHDYSTTHRIA